MFRTETANEYRSDSWCYLTYKVHRVSLQQCVISYTLAPSSSERELFLWSNHFCSIVELTKTIEEVVGSCMSASQWHWNTSVKALRNFSLKKL